MVVLVLTKSSSSSGGGIPMSLLLKFLVYISQPITIYTVGELTLCFNSYPLFQCLRVIIVVVYR